MAIRPKEIKIRGAKLHNLKNVDLDIPLNKMTVITGVSGSGKSSLAFDTLYAEGQRRFVESLSTYARQFLERMGKPDVESITGLPPAIAIEQRPYSKNPRSTVGTTTEIYDYLKLLYARAGVTYCRKCGKIVKKDSPEIALHHIEHFDEGDRIYIYFDYFVNKRNLGEDLQKLKLIGFFRFSINDEIEIIDINNLDNADIIKDNAIKILVDRFAYRTDSDTLSRINDSLETSFNSTQDKIIVVNETKQSVLKFSAKFECADCDIQYVEPDPKIFSFNNPFGACHVCQGFGRTVGIDEELVIPDTEKSIKRGAIQPFKGIGGSLFLRKLVEIAPANGIDINIPYQEISADKKKIIWEGIGDYEGVNGFFKMLEENNYKMGYRILHSKYRGFTICRACGGSRIRTSARQVFFNEKNIPELIKLPLTRLLDFFNAIQLNEYEEKVVGNVLKELRWRSQLLVDIGLGYLTLERLSHTLSGGETQRINLSTSLGSALVGTLYVLDEPSIGLHQRDTNRLLDILYKLRDLGNTIVVVEHDFDIIRKADLLIDMGPNAGQFGGEIVFRGKFDDIYKAEKSLTAKYLRNELRIELPELRRTSNKKLVLKGAKEHNLNIDRISFPLNTIICVTGVSGSGKSTLIMDILYPALKKLKGTFEGGMVGNYESISGHHYIDNLELVDQNPIGKSSRSTPITYIKGYDYIRDIYANTQESKQNGFKAGHFSFNVDGGRCEVCEGEGTVTVNMQFLPDVKLLCESCKGSRFKREVVNVKFREKSIVDVLNMTIDEAFDFFRDFPKVQNKLNILRQVGLGYLKLGQPSTMLSGGEAQRVKLANHLESDSKADLLYLFDEPTTGLHIDDVNKLLKCFDRLVRHGNSVIIIEHNINVVAYADWIIDLGPEAGEFGGKIVAQGTPEMVAQVEASHTGKALREFFELNK
jgi:excinuclease ABC subunit A